MESDVSAFIMDSCLVGQGPSNIKIIALDSKINFISEHAAGIIISGSVSEFYIEPMLHYVGDIDLMHSNKERLFIPEGHRMNKFVQLPTEFKSAGKLKLYELIDSPLPGYVFIRLAGHLVKSTQSNSHSFVRLPFNVLADLATSSLPNEQQRRGPALPGGEISSRHVGNELVTSSTDCTSLLIDYVLSERCLLWVPQASDWPTRHRSHGWPDAQTIRQIINNGCDIVKTAHRKYKNNERMKQKMWRLSFSRAETVLLNSWTLTQQVAYHVLRFVIKTADLIEPDAKQMIEHNEQFPIGIFTNYHLKSVVLWACERHSRDWWSSSVVSIVARLLNTLSECASSAMCRSYFVKDCNLFESLTTAHSHLINGVVVRLESIINEPLCMWLLNTYVSQCAQQCPSVIVGQLKSAKTKGQLREALSAIITWRRHYECKSVSIPSLDNLMLLCQQAVWNNQIDTCEELYEEIIKIDERIRVWLKALLLARLALAFGKNTRPDVAAQSILKIVILLKTGKSDRLVEQSCLKSTKELFQRSLAVAKDELMNSKISQASRVTSSLQTELVRALLNSLLKCPYATQCVHHNEVCLGRMYLALGFYKTKQYDAVVCHCSLATHFCHVRCHERIEARVLVNADEVVGVAWGFIFLYRFICRTFSHQQYRIQEAEELTVKFSAFYLLMKAFACMNNTMSFMQTFRRYERCLKDSHRVLVGDVFLFYVAKEIKTRLKKVQVYSRCQASRESSRKSLSVSCTRVGLQRLLTELAVEHLTAFRQAMSRDYSPNVLILTTDYEALFLYKCGEYERCFELCRQGIDFLLSSVEIRLLTVFHLPPSDLLLLLGEEILCVIGVAFLLGCFADDRAYREKWHFSQVAVLHYLILQCKLQLKHPLMSFFDDMHEVGCFLGKCPERSAMDRVLLVSIFRKVIRAFIRQLERNGCSVRCVTKFNTRAPKPFWRCRHRVQREIAVRVRL